MRILLTNDDGYKAEGINTLFSVLSKKYDVYMIAPSQERSACSNAVTMRETLTLKKTADKIFSLSGFPADCVNVALHGKIIPKVDIVISGINHGPNLGDDTYYSGTVAGARTSFINGTNGIAVSLCGKPCSEYFTDCSEYIAEFLDSNSGLLSKKRLLLNINYPSCGKTKIKGASFSFLDKRHYIDEYITVNDQESHQTLRLEGTVESDRLKGSDFDLTSDNYISITPLLLDSTDYNEIKQKDGLIINASEAKECQAI